MSEHLPAYVVDASVAVKWLLPLADEPHNDLALQSLTAARDGRIELIGPDRIGYEVGHALRRAARRGCAFRRKRSGRPTFSITA